MPRLRLRLRTVLVVLSLSVLVLPAASLQVLRLYESALLRQTESALVAQGVIVSAAYRAAFRNQDGADLRGNPVDAMPAKLEPILDFADSPVHPPLPAALPGAAPDGLALRIGTDLTAILKEAKAVTWARIRVVDYQGVVVATTENDQGMSFAHGEEVRQALAGRTVSRLRRSVVPVSAPVALISQAASVRVFFASPIVLEGRSVGAVLLSRVPKTILDVLSRRLLLVMQGAALVLVLVVGVALVVARTLVLPIRRIARSADRLARGETHSFERGRPFRVIEVAQLAVSVEAMAHNLQHRASYVRDFTRHVNHEFKTPIAAMRGTVELLRDHLDDMTVEERRRFLDNVSTDVGRLERLTLGLLELSRADMANASSEVTDLLHVARCLAAAVHVPAGQAHARIPRTSAEAALKNLVENAMRYGASKVEVRTERSGANIVLRVEDDGPGISPGNRPHVFQPFFTTDRDRGGTGLGLSITQALIRHAGGDIELAPSRRGAAFRITLPAAEPPTP